MADDCILSGELGLISLFDLGQLLMLNGATGVLTLHNEGSKAYVYFVRGQIVNVVDDEYNEGEEAAYRLFGWKVGTYEFRPGTASDSRAITVATEGLMMEAARRLDESQPGEAGGRADRLARRASSLDALRQAFQSVASQTRAMPESGDPQGGSPFEMLRDASDALLLRPGHVPRVRLHGSWRDAGAQLLEPGAFEQLRARLADGAETRPGGDVATWVATHDDGRRYEIARLVGEHEALWVRPADLVPPGPESLDGPVDIWRCVLAAPAGLLLVAGPDPESADRLFHACVAEIARTHPGAVLLHADHGRWAHEEGPGALVCAPPADDGPARDALSPDVAAFDLASTPASAGALHGATRVVATVIAPGPATAVARWCARIGRRWGDGIEGLVGGAPVDVVHATGTRGADGRIPFGVVQFELGGDLSLPAAERAARSAATPAGHPSPASKPHAAPAVGGRKARAVEPAAPSPAPDAATPAQPAIPLDPMAALAAELTRSLGKAA